MDCLVLIAATFLSTTTVNAEQIIRTSMTVEEKRSNNYLVGNVKSAVQHHISKQDFDNVTISEYLDDLSKFNLFKVSPNGDIRINEYIDRDILCTIKRRCCDKDMTYDKTRDLVICKMNYFLQATVAKTNKIYIIQCTMEIIDKNDHKPQFPSKIMIVHFKETNELTTSTTIQLAKDKDWGKNSVITYKLQEPSEIFGLRLVKDRQTKGDMDKIIAVELFNKVAIDREAKSWYRLTVIAEDGDRNSASMFINVTIDDVNDCKPIFANDGEYKVEIPEDTFLHTPILTVKATDQDIGRNGDVKYRFKDTMSRYPYALFAITSNTGDLVLATKIPYKHDEDNIYKLEVTATDNGVPPLTAEATVTVKILDVNDHSPVIKVISFNNQNSFIKVKENVMYNGDYGIAKVLVHDNDAGDNSRVSCKLKNGNDKFQLSFISKLTDRQFIYHINAKGKFDRETKSEYSLGVECWDHGINAKKTEYLLKVDVEDANDCPPVWTQSIYRYKVTENSKEGTLIGMPQAYDNDIAPNNIINYRIDQDDFQLVTIDRIYGKLLVKGSLDREEQDKYTFQIVAFNTEEPKYSSTATVELTVEDVNDNPPVLNKPINRIAVSEDIAPMTVFAKLNVTDKDEPSARYFTFVVRNENNTRAAKFDVTASGDMRVISKLDRELESQYNLKIIITDNGKPPNSFTYSMTIEVEDVNDSFPRFVYPTHTSNELNISKSFTVGNKIANIMAIDDDIGENKRLTYRIIATFNNKALDYFDLDADSGHLTLKKPLTNEPNKKIFTLQIEVSDNGKEKQNSRKQNLKLQVVEDDNSLGPGLKNEISSDKRQYNERGKGSTTGNLLIVLLVVCLSVLVLLVLTLAVIYLVSKRRAETHQQQQDNDGENKGSYSYDTIVKPDSFTKSFHTLPRCPDASSMPLMHYKRDREFTTMDPKDTMIKRRPTDIADGLSYPEILKEMQQQKSATVSHPHMYSPQIQHKGSRKQTDTENYSVPMAETPIDNKNKPVTYTKLCTLTKMCNNNSYTSSESAPVVKKLPYDHVSDV